MPYKSIGKQKMESNDIYSRSIPVLAESFKVEPEFKMVRCIYFSIECDTPMPGWHLSLNEQIDIPFIMLGLSGIIYQPIGSTGGFDDYNKINTLFDTIEKEPGIYIDTNDIWLPNNLFTEITGEKVKGHIFRISFDLFVNAWQYRNDRITLSEFEKYCNKTNNKMINTSEKETQAFNDWWKELIEETRRQYHESEKRLQLRYKGKEKG